MTELSLHKWTEKTLWFEKKGLGIGQRTHTKFKQSKNKRRTKEEQKNKDNGKYSIRL